MLYYLFGWSDFHPAGGIDDLIGQFDSIEEAKNYFNEKFQGYAAGHIVDGNFNILTICGRYATVDNPVHYKNEHWINGWRDVL